PSCFQHTRSKHELRALSLGETGRHPIWRNSRRVGWESSGQQRSCWNAGSGGAREGDGLWARFRSTGRQHHPPYVAPFHAVVCPHIDAHERTDVSISVSLVCILYVDEDSHPGTGKTGSSFRIRSMQGALVRRGDGCGRSSLLLYAISIIPSLL
ncbi:unnamed protein product, partial [Ectocarpus sp. 13 AM-2016]